MNVRDEDALGQHTRVGAPKHWDQNTPVLVQGRVWPMNVTESSLLIGIKIEKKGECKNGFISVSRK